MVDMKVMAVLARLFLLVVLLGILAILVPGRPDTFLVNLGWLLLVVAVFAIGPSRRLVLRWLSTGRLRPPPA